MILAARRLEVLSLLRDGIFHDLSAELSWLPGTGTALILLAARQQITFRPGYASAAITTPGYAALWRLEREMPDFRKAP